MLIKRWGFALTLILWVSSSAQAADDATVLSKATKLLEEISSDPDSGISPQFLQEAKGIMIMPHIVETQLGVGRKKGHGIFLARNSNGEWGNLQTITISATSVGAEVGREVTDAVTIYRTAKSAKAYEKISLAFRLSADAMSPLRHRRKSGDFTSNLTVNDDVIIYTRRHGGLVGATMSTERKWSPSLFAELDKPSTTVNGNTDKTAARATKRDARVSNAEADSPEVTQLKTVLTAMTVPPDQVAKSATLTQKARPTGAEKRAAATSDRPGEVEPAKYVP